MRAKGAVHVGWPPRKASETGDLGSEMKREDH